MRPEHIKAYAAVARGGLAIDLGERRYDETNALPGVFRTRVAPLMRATARRAHPREPHRSGRCGLSATCVSKANEFLDAIVENIPAMVFVKEAKELSLRERINRAGEKLLGVTREALLGKNDFDFFPPEQAQFFQAKDRDTFLAKTPVDVVEEPIQTPQGERWLHTKKVPLFDAQGEPRFLLGISEDITEQRRAAGQLKKLVKQLEESNAELDGFTHSISHDLRAPLRAIHGFANILIEDHVGTLSDEGRRLADTIARNTVKMGALIDDLLNFSRLGRLQVERRAIDMAQMVRQTIAELDLEGRDVEFRVGELPKAAGDAAVMKQVWVNLIDNAVKYTRTRAKAIIEITGDVRIDLSRVLRERQRCGLRRDLREQTVRRVSAPAHRARIRRNGSRPRAGAAHRAEARRVDHEPVGHRRGSRVRVRRARAALRLCPA